ncbi:MAG: 4Fe-4S dicluster domain-containing protein [Coriobacteriaceae bacterium]|jgi:Fe-S-cluster-containing dehydrogenase component|nr:4Fe-4S dicluster domain-containing protein [Coriobacteriaceae bacterium]
MTQYAIATDLNKCIGCLACSVGCKILNDVPIGSFWNKTLRIGPHPRTKGGQWPDIYTYFLTVSCQHCDDPECTKVCPTGASAKQENGTIQIDKNKCIGCQFCVMACPYGVRYLNVEERIVEKCTLCEHMISQGLLPQCVSQCSARARWFGDIEKGIMTFEAPGCDLNDKSYEAMVRKRYVLKDMIGEGCDSPVKPFDEKTEVHHLPNVGNGPNFLYILRGEQWQGGKE